MERINDDKNIIRDIWFFFVFYFIQILQHKAQYFFFNKRAKMALHRSPEYQMRDLSG